MLANKPMQVGASHPSEMEVIREIRFVKGHKTAGPSGPSPSFKDGGDVLTSELTKILESICAREQIPKY